MTPIRVEKLTKIYKGKVRALNEISFSIGKNEMVGLLGPNGSGKTTAIKILTGLLRQTSGRAFIYELDVLEDQKAALENVGAVVEVPEFYPFLTPIETLRFLGQLRGMTESDIDLRSRDLLEMFGLAENAMEKVGRFSKGMKQRLALAQALLHEPDVLILDEPTDGLDPEGIADMRRILLDLRKRGVTILMSSHHLMEVQNTCDRILMIDRGRIVADDSVEHIAQEVRVNCYDLVLAGEPSPDSLNRIKSIQGVADVKRKSSRMVVVDVDDSFRSGEWLLNEILSLGLRVESFHSHDIPLETYYVQRKQDGE